MGDKGPIGDTGLPQAGNDVGDMQYWDGNQWQILAAPIFTSTNCTSAGNGTDKLSGGAGADTFDFNSLIESVKGTTRDSITDFTHSQGDKIDLAGIDANSKVTGDQGFSYIAAKAFTGVAGELDYLKGILAGDTNGDKVADFEIAITLVGGSSLVSADFVL